MKKQLYLMLAALLLAASAIPATAQTATSGEMTNTQAFMDKMGEATIQELLTESKTSGEKPTKVQIAQKLFGKLRENMEAFKTAFVRDCIIHFGEDKAENCKCAADKTDFDTHINLLEKEMVNPDAAGLAEEQEQWRAKNMQIEKDCGLEKNSSSP